MLEKHAVTGNLISIEIFSFLVSFAPFFRSVIIVYVAVADKQTDGQTRAALLILKLCIIIRGHPIFFLLLHLFWE